MNPENRVLPITRGACRQTPTKNFPSDRFRTDSFGQTPRKNLLSAPSPPGRQPLQTQLGNNILQGKGGETLPASQSNIFVANQIGQGGGGSSRGPPGGPPGGPPRGPPRGPPGGPPGGSGFPDRSGGYSGGSGGYPGRSGRAGGPSRDPPGDPDDPDEGGGIPQIGNQDAPPLIPDNHITLDNHKEHHPPYKQTKGNGG